MMALGRRRLEVALGGLWLLDGVLQLQPHMWTAAYFSNTLGMGDMGLPAPAAGLDYGVTTMLVSHPLAWNTLFAGLQLGPGIALVRGGRAASVARPLSIAWAFGVWYLGEGFGGIFMGGASVLNGAPGAALFYGLLTLAVRPARGPEDPARVRRRALIVWSTLWLCVALLETAGTNRMSFVPGAEIRDAGPGEPGWLTALDRAVGNAVGMHGAAFALALGLLATGLATAPLRRSLLRPALGAGVVLGLFLGLVGGGFGGLMTGSATDPGLAPIFLLLGFGAWPPAPELEGDRPRPEPARLPEGQPIALPAA